MNLGRLLRQGVKLHPIKMVEREPPAAVVGYAIGQIIVRILLAQADKAVEAVRSQLCLG